MEVGFVGLGAMGSNVAKNLLRGGHSVHVWNRSPEPAARLAEFGATVASSVDEALAHGIAFSMLADDRAVRAVLVDSGALARVPVGTVIVNLATISLELARELVALQKARRFAYVAAPVLGRPDVAATGKLNVVAAGDAAALDRVQPLLDAIGERTWRVGDHPVSANVVKIVANFMLACAIEAISEGVALTKAYGVDAAETMNVLTNTLFAAPAYKTYGNLVIEERFAPAGFTLSLGFKDLKLALGASEEARVPLPFGSVLRDAFLQAMAYGNEDLDWSALSKVAAERSSAAIQS